VTDNWAVFMDRDGTINYDPGYLGDPEKVQLLPKVPEAIKLLNEAGAKVIVVSNQSGVARGFFTEEVVRKVNERLREKLLLQRARIDDFYFCPHHPDFGEEPYRIDCECRKPKPGLLIQAAREHGIDLSHSFVVGDKLSDIEAGLNAGCRTILVLNGKDPEVLAIDTRLNASPDYIAPDLYEAAEWILKQRMLRERKHR